jgi:aminopeptidase
MDIRIKKHVEILVNYSLNVKKDEKVLIQGDVTVLPMIKECYRQILQKGAFPQIKVGCDEVSEILLKTGNNDQIQYIPASAYKTVETVDAVLTIIGPSNTRILSDVKPDKLKLSAQGQTKYRNIFYGREAEGKLRWCLTLFPTLANAQEANMSYADYCDFVYEACGLKHDNPIKIWQKMHEEQQRICDILDTKKHLRIVAKDTDISMLIEGRKWIDCSGQVNFPDGEIFTGPVENTVEGHIRFSFPGIYNGNAIEDIKLSFEKGKVVKASATKGEELLQQLLETDEGARFVGEIAVGTNYNNKRFTRNMLFDEKIGGTVHLAIGRSFPESKAKNLSAIHWDMLCDMSTGGKIFADNEIIYKNGKFLI